jgi:hypothetical protein
MTTPDSTTQLITFEYSPRGDHEQRTQQTLIFRNAEWSTAHFDSELQHEINRIFPRWQKPAIQNP